MILRLLGLLLCFLHYTLADVDFQSPSAGSTVTGTTLSIKWKDSGNSPSISDLASYQLFLCAGGNSADNFIQLATLVTTGSFSDGNSVQVDIQLTLGADEKNAYFLKMISAATGGSIINYSDRFSISGMAGVFPSNVDAGVQSITGTSGPPTENEINQPAAGAGDPQETGLEYSMQTGPTRYAPMPIQPGTKITDKNPSRRYPESSYNIFTAIAGSPDAQVTLSPGGTFSVQSMENTAAPAPQPTDTAMERFLNRWKD